MPNTVNSGPVDSNPLNSLTALLLGTLCTSTLCTSPGPAQVQPTETAAPKSLAYARDIRPIRLPTL